MTARDIGSAANLTASVGRRDVVLASILAVSWGSHTAFVNPLFALYFSRDLGMTSFELSGSLVLFNLAGLVASFVLPLVSDRTGRMKPLLLLCALSAVTCFMVASFNLDRRLAVTNIVILGAPSLASIAVLFTYYRRRGFSDKQTLRFRGYFAAAWTAGPPLATFIVDSYSFRVLFISVAVLGCASLVAGLAITDSPSQLQDSSAHERGSGAPFVKSVRHAGPVVIAILSALILLQTSNSASVSLLPLLTSETPHGARLAGLALGLCAGLEVVWLLLLARLRPRAATFRFNSRMMVLGSAAGFLYLAILFVSTRIEWVLAGQLLNSFFIAAVMGTGLLWMQSAIPHRAGLATALYSNTSRVGAVLAAPIVSLYAIPVASLGSIAPAIGASLCLLALLICLFSNRPIRLGTHQSGVRAPR